MIKYIKYLFPILFGIFLMSESTFACSPVEYLHDNRPMCVNFGEYLYVYTNDVSMKYIRSYSPKDPCSSESGYYTNTEISMDCSNILSLYLRSHYFDGKISLGILLSGVLFITGITYFLFRKFKKKKQLKEEVVESK